MAELITHYIGGRFIESARRFSNISPVDGAVVGEVCEASADEVDQAVRAARAALQGDWGRCGPTERSDWLRRLADGIERRFDEFVEAEVRDTGRTVRQARTLDVPRAIANFRFFADLVRQAHTECFETVTTDGGRALNYTVRKPLGVRVLPIPTRTVNEMTQLNLDFLCDSRVMDVGISASAPMLSGGAWRYAANRAESEKK
ncbi:MAG: aldehyde dehydrogenase family protein [Burkholderiales bacterium]|nr:aldehyde dehydrogenase family protein [Burkholderiales bacterium]